MNKKSIIILLILLVALSFCGKKSDTKGIDLKVKMIPGAVTDDLYGKMKYSFDLSEKFAGIEKNYKVFVHFWRIKNKEMLFQDDYFPEAETSSWKKGDKFEYVRDIYIPKFLDEYDIDFEGYEEIKLSVGIYNIENNEEKILLFEKVLNIQSASLNAPEIVYDEGWHQSETDFNSKIPNIGEWRWTSGKAVCIIENPKKEAILKLKGRISEHNLQGQKIRLMINDILLDEFVPEGNIFEKDYIISADKLGNNDELRFIIEVDKTFIPGKLDESISDDRELGVQIFSIYFRENLLD